jgi:hypothetical protein
VEQPNYKSQPHFFFIIPISRNVSLVLLDTFFQLMLISQPHSLLNTGIAYPIYVFCTGWTIRGSKPGGMKEIFCSSNPSGQTGGPTQFPVHYVEREQVSFTEVKRPGCGVDHPSLYSTLIKNELRRASSSPLFLHATLRRGLYFPLFFSY